MKLRINNANGRGDLVMGDRGIATDQGLETVCQMMAHCDGRADPNDVLPDGSDDPRGYWGDVLQRSGFKLGNKVWTLDGKATPQNRRKAADFLVAGYQPLIKQGVVAEIRADATRIVRDDVIAVFVEFLKPTQVGLRWEGLWVELDLGGSA